MKYMMLTNQGTSPTPQQPDAWAALAEEEQQRVVTDDPAERRLPTRRFDALNDVPDED